MKRLLVGALLFASTLFGTEGQKEFIVGVENIEYFPQFSNDNGEYKGFARELLDEFAKDKGYKFTYEPLPIKRLLEMFLRGRVDFKYPDNIYWAQDEKKDKKLIYSEPVVEYIDGVVVAPEKVGKTTLAKLGTIRGFTPFEYMEDIKKGTTELNEASNMSSLLSMGIVGKIDGVYVNVAVARYVLNEQLKKPNALVFDKNLKHTKSNYHFATIKHEAVMKEFNDWMKLRADWIKTTKKKYKLTLE